MIDYNGFFGFEINLYAKFVVPMMGVCGTIMSKFDVIAKFKICRSLLYLFLELNVLMLIIVLQKNSFTTSRK